MTSIEDILRKINKELEKLKQSKKMSTGEREALRIMNLQFGIIKGCFSPTCSSLIKCEKAIDSCRVLITATSDAISLSLKQSERQKHYMRITQESGRLLSNIEILCSNQRPTRIISWLKVFAPLLSIVYVLLDFVLTVGEYRES